MKLSFLFSALLASALLSPFLHAEDPEDGKTYLLQYKFKMGEVLRYRVTHAADNRTTMEGATRQAETTSESIKAWKVTDVLPSGEMEFVHVVEWVKMSNRVPNRAAITYDSKTDKTAPPGFEQVARSVGVPISLIRIMPSGEITHREEKSSQPAATEDMPITLQLADEPLVLGAQWDFTYDVAVDRENGTKQQVRTRRLATLKDVKAGIATIEVEYQILTPVSAYVEAQLVDRLTKGAVRFDIEAGRIVSQELHCDRHIIGFSGSSSSMHCVSKLEEKLLGPEDRMAKRE